MARKYTSFADELISAPWWVSATLGVVCYGVFRFVLPFFWGNTQVSSGTNSFSSVFLLKGLAQQGPFIANFTMFFFLAMAVLSFGRSFFKGRKRLALFENTKSMETLRSLSWQDFEKLVGEAYRRRGYTILETGGGGADGGVDLVLKKNGETIFVQCKHWKMERVGVVLVRELLGVVYDKKASGGVVITSGTFTQEAQDFSKGNPIELVDGKKLYVMIGEMKTTTVPSRTEKLSATGMHVQDKRAPMLCPVCGMEMVLRTAKKGPSAGTKFYGCSRYPKCKGVRSY